MQSSEQLTKLAIALGGLPVLGCRPGSPAARAGVRYGDVLLTVNGIKTPDWATYIEARAVKKGEMTLQVFRSGEELELAMVFDTHAPNPQDWLDYLSGDEYS
ncbi:MAG: PDZ domain-containing protein [Kofleriaceae bacterium]